MSGNKEEAKVTLNTSDCRHTATTKQTKWHTSTAASRSEYGIVVEEMNDTGRARAPIGSTGGNENAWIGDMRVVPDNMSTVQETDRDAGVENVEHLIERIKKLEEQSKEMQQRFCDRFCRARRLIQGGAR